MATSAAVLGRDDDARFFLKLAVAITLTIFGAFTMHMALGRSTFSQPAIYHAHGIIFMGWAVIYLTQHWLVVNGRMGLHRRLGWLSLAWVGLMLVFGIAITVTVIQRGTTPFFFLPQHFLIANPLTLFAFVGLVVAAIAMRKRTDWHRRLHLCAMAMILGPAFGRLFPSPFLIPWAFEISSLAGLVFPLIALAREWRRGSVHPAWRWGLPVLPLVLLFAYAFGHSVMAGNIYGWVAAGTAGATVDPLAYGQPPPGM
jgi:hypothetical protein